MTKPAALSLLYQAPAAPDQPSGLADGVLQAPAGWPAAPDPVAYHGLAGEIVSKLEPHTEADPVAILTQLLVAFGAAAGRGAYFQVEATFASAPHRPLYRRGADLGSPRPGRHRRRRRRPATAGDRTGVRDRAQTDPA